MLTETEFYYYRDVEQNLSEAGKDYLTGCYMGDGARLVGTHARRNIVSWVPSEKLNDKTFSTESMGPERALNTLMQFKKHVLWYGDQPEPVDVIRTIKNSRKRRGTYIGDGIALSTFGPSVYEAKTKSKIEELLEENPNDWLRNENGEVIYKPARDAFSKLGIKHKVFVYSSEQQVHIANLNQILWARQSHHVSIDPQMLNKVMRNKFAVTLEELRGLLKLDSITPLIKAIDTGLLFIDIENQLIGDTENCLVSTTKPLLEHAVEIRKKNLVYQKGFASSKDVELVPTLKSAEKALEKLNAIKEGKSSRSVRRWKVQIKEGEKKGLSPFQSLIPKYHRCGKSRKLNIKVEKFLMDYLLNDFIYRQGMSFYRGHCDYYFLAEGKHPEFEPVTRKTFTLRYYTIPPEIAAEARGGRRLSNSKAAPTDPEERHLKAMMAWERAAVDHYLVDLYLIVYTKKGKVIVERPWLTLMIDLYSGKVIAFSISFRKPSRKSVAKVIRACVRQHGKLPREIIFDRGAEFKSVYLAALLAHYRVILSLRPAADPKYGGEVEGFFGEFMKEWLSQRDGNLADKTEARSIDGKKTPKKSAILSPADFYRELKKYCLWRENSCRGIGSETSEYEFDRSQKMFPHIPISVEYDSDFLVATCVEPKKYTVDMQKGINIDNVWYSSPKMRLLLGKPSRNNVRPDPEVPNLIFVKVLDRWEPFYATEINSYSAKLEEHQIAEGMLISEAAYLKRKIRERDDIELAGLVREMDKFRENNNQTPIVDIDIRGNKNNQSVIFSKLKNANLRPINVKSWGN
ncbi:integrase catalytic domain-containing protein [Saccharophagus degradans]|uniref:Transposase family protein n=1 Tax=Saccharophagus degradans TaxID=86304 RepID=A0AAW7X901_9GAMM|nr:transposase family protein [Saccharophagus degradans]MDO6423056.1 transposase family protein [Saccharophagus degradans]MDO6607420.1 transposase family protein [Saccharophagus degradans]